MRMYLAAAVISTWVGAALVVPAAPPKEERVLAEAGVHAFYSPDGQRIAVSSKSGTFTLIEAQAPWGKKPIEGEFLHAAAFTPDSQFLVLTDSQERLHFVRVTTAKVARTVPTKLMYENDHVSWIAFASDGQHIAVNTARGFPRIFDAAGKNPVDLEKCIARRPVFSPDNKTLIGADGDGRIATWEVATGKRLQVWQVTDKKKSGGGIEHCVFSADGKLAIACENGTDRIHIWDLAAGNKLGQLQSKGTFVSSMALTRDGKIVAVACRPKKAKPMIQLWNVASQRELDGIAAVPAHVSEMNFSPDGKHLVVATTEDNKSKVKAAARLFAMP